MVNDVQGAFETLSARRILSDHFQYKGPDFRLGRRHYAQGRDNRISVGKSPKMLKTIGGEPVVLVSFLHKSLFSLSEGEIPHLSLNV